MSKIILVAVSAIILTGCTSQVREAVRKDPKIVFDAIEENPEAFLDAVNRAAKKAQQNQFEKQSAKLGPELRLEGSSQGKIVLVEYADFQCPACRMAYDSLKEFKSRHQGEIQFYFKNMPLDFHKMALPSAQYFEAVRMQGQDKALKFYNYVFEHQRDLANQDFLKEAALQAGADIKQVEQDIHCDAVKKRIAEDMAEFQKFGFNGTPALILNGVPMSGAQPLEAMERVVAMPKSAQN